MSTDHQPDADVYSRHEIIDPDHSVDLDAQGSPGYSAVVVTPVDTERLLLVRRDALGLDGARFWTEQQLRQVAPHELTGRLPKPYAPICGCRATSSGKPCKVRVSMWGDACPRHALIDSERSHA